MTQLESHHEQLAAAGLQVICIAQGELKHMQRYCPKFVPSAICLTDESTDPYYAYGVQQGSTMELLSPNVLLAGVRAYSKGNVNGEILGDIKMRSGMFIIDTDGLVRYAYYSEYQGDHPKLNDVIAAAQKI